MVKARKEICWYYVAFMFIGLPLFFMEKYFNISQEKWLFFTVCSLIFIAVCLFTVIFSKETPALFKADFKTFGVTEYAFIGLLVANFISFWLSVDRSESLTGTSSRHHGFMSMLIYVVLFFLIRGNYTDHEHLMGILAGTGALVCIFSICQFLGYDPLGFYKNITVSSIHRMISTIGNMNIFSSYLNIIAPVTLYLYLTAKNFSSSFLYGICVGLCATGGLASTSDSFYLGTCAAVIFMFAFGGLNKRSVRRFCSAGMIVAFYDFALLLAARIIKNKGIIFSDSLKEVGFAIRPLKGVTGFLYNNLWVLGIVFGVSFIFWIIMYFSAKGIKAEDYFFTEKNAKALTWIAVSAAAVAIVFIAISYPYENETGSYRGFIWNLAIDDFKGAEFFRKLFGYGQETILGLYRERYHDIMVETTGVIYDNVHSEPLQYLVTTGLFGLGFYLTAVISIIARLAKKLRKQPGLYVLLLPIISYLVQSFVNIAQSATTPLFFIIIALAAAPKEEM